MKKLRMTIEELNSLVPSVVNPIELKCDDGSYVDDLKEIKVLSLVYKDQFLIEDNTGRVRLFTQAEEDLGHYPSFKNPPEEPKKWYTVVYKVENERPGYYFMLCESEEDFLNLSGKQKSDFDFIKLIPLDTTYDQN